MKNTLTLVGAGALMVLAAAVVQPAAAGDEIIVGFAGSQTGFMEAYSQPSTNAALIAIESPGQITTLKTAMNSSNWESRRHLPRRTFTSALRPFSHVSESKTMANRGCSFSRAVPTPSGN